MGTGMMTKKKASKAIPERKAIAVTLKASPEWKTWVEEAAEFCRTDVAKLIDAALVDYLKVRGFGKEAPRR